MHSNSVFRFIGILVMFLGLSMVMPLAVSFTYGDEGTLPLLWSMIVTTATGALVLLCTKKKQDIPLNHRDGVAIVTFGWIAAGIAGAVPFLFSGSIDGFTNACFESISGFTTTGATIMTNIESVPPGILMWRSLTQWLGGMGIIVLSIAVLPFLGVGGMQLYRAEIPSPVVDKLKPRISDTAKTLWKVYLIITVLEIVFLMAGGMSLYDSVSHTFCTMPTGGFSPKNASVAFYDSPYLDGVIILFMLIAGINFSLHYKLIAGDLRSYFKDTEFRVFISIVAAFTIIITIDVFGKVYDSIFSAFRFASFQVSSIISTTGFATADYELWPALSKYILLICMFLGGMAGSTGGGLKTMRIILLIKQGYRELFKIIHPHSVTSIKLGGRPVPPEVLSSIWGFFILYLGLFVVTSLFMTFLGLDLISSFSSVAACIFNVGPGLGMVGPVDNYMSIPFAGKWVLIFCMLLGRLEIYTVIVLLTPEYWRK